MSKHPPRSAPFALNVSQQQQLLGPAEGEKLESKYAMPQLVQEDLPNYP